MTYVVPTVLVPAAVGGPARLPWMTSRTLRLTVGFIALLATTAAVRVHRLGDASLWADECMSLECSAGWGRADLRVAAAGHAAPDLVTSAGARPWTAIWSAMAADENHPPLYFLLLRAWRSAFGDSATAIRSLSVLASVVAVGLTTLAGAELAGAAAGGWAGLIMAVAWPQVREAQDARAYALVTALAAAALLLLVRTLRRGPTPLRTAALAVVLLAMPLMHYMALATVGGVAVFALLVRGPAGRAIGRAAGVAVAAFALLWGPAMVGQRQHMFVATRWLVEQTSTAAHVDRTLINVAIVPVRLLIDPGREPSLVVAAGGLMLLLGPPLLVWHRRRSGRAAPPPTALLLWVWVVVPVATALVIDLSTGRQSLWYAKYTLAAAPALYLAAAVLAASGRRLTWVPAVVAVAGGLLCLPAAYDPIEPDWRPLARFVVSHTAPGEPVVLTAEPDDLNSAGVRLAELTYYLNRAGQSRPIYVVDGPPTGAVRAALARARHACVIGSDLTPATNRLLHGLAIDHAETFAGLGIAGTAARPAAGAVPVAIQPRSEDMSAAELEQ